MKISPAWLFAGLTLAGAAAVVRESVPVPVTFHFVKGHSGPKVHTLTVPPERVRSVALQESKVLPAWNGNQGLFPIGDADLDLLKNQGP